MSDIIFDYGFADENGKLISNDDYCHKFWEGKEVLITGGTGTLGKAITKLLLTEYKPKGIRIFSRDEAKQEAFKQELQASDLSGNVGFYIGDVRDVERLKMAMARVDIVIHTAAMKQVPACEFNPIEAIMTNINGAKNVITAAVACEVKNVMNIATDKGVYPLNFYGCTKAVAEKLFIFSNIYSPEKTLFSCCRYGNVIGSRGSVVPLFKKQFAETGTISVTDRNMTRFWISVKRVANFVVRRVSDMEGGEIFIPNMKAMNIVDLANIICPGAEIADVGIREGEKIHECLVSKEESKRVSFISSKDETYYVIGKKVVAAHYNCDLTSEICHPYSVDEMKILLEE